MKKKKLLKTLIIIVIVVLFLLIFTIGILNVINKKQEEKIVDGKYTQKDIEIIQNEVTNYLSDKITPRGMSRLYGQYNGMNEPSELYRNLYVLVSILPEISKVSYNGDKELNSYYEKNIEKLEEIGITEKNQFISFANYLKETGYNGEKFSYCQIETNTFKYVDGYLTFDLSFYFDNFENEFKLKVNFANSSAAEPIVFYTTDTEKSLEEEKVELENNENDLNNSTEQNVETVEVNEN